MINNLKQEQALLSSLQGQIIAHRGASAFAPENTLSSFKKAALLKAKWVEFDIQLCASNDWVVFHDETLERTTNGQGLVRQQSYKSLQKLDAGAWFHPSFKGETIPKLGELLIQLLALQLQPNIEIKNLEADDSNGIQSFISLLDKVWPKSSLPPLVSSFDLALLINLKKAAPTLPISLIVEDIEPDILSLIQRHGFFSLHCNYENLQTSNLPKFLSQNLPILVYTVNEEIKAKYYMDNGICAVFSDTPNFIEQSPGDRAITV